MKYCVIDTEATGLWTSDEIIQFSGLLTDENFNVLNFVNFYCDTLKTISSDAFALHNISNTELTLRSGGKFFESYRNGVYKQLFEMDDVIWIGWNIQFDIRMINNTLTNNGYDPVDFGDRVAALNVTKGRHWFDLMPAASGLLGAGYRMKLIDAVAKCGFTAEQVSAAFTNISKLFKFDDDSINLDSSYHRANYDVVATWMVMNSLNNRLR